MADQEPLTLQEVLADERAAIFALRDAKLPLSALCISGGGIRSATFALGALQALASHGLLAQFDYLSTVSGGGYIGGWLSAWIKQEGIEKVVRRLRPDAPKTPEGEIDPIQHLREYNNYLSPELGGFSADTWTLVATVVRNVALNWLVLIPLLMGLLMAPRVLTAVAFLSQHYALEHPLDQRHVVDSWIVVIGLPAAVSVLFIVGMLNMWRYLPGIGGVNHSGSDYVKWVLGPLIAATVLFTIYDALRFWNTEFGTLTIWTCVVATLLQAGLSWLAFLLFWRKNTANQVKIAPLTLAIGLLALSLGSAEWLVTNKVSGEAMFSWSHYCTIVPPLIGLSFFAALALFAGLSSCELDDKDREWLSRASAGVLLASVGWLVVCFTVLEAPKWVFAYKTWAGSALTALGTVSAWASRLSRRDQKAPPGKPDCLGAAIQYAPPVFLVCLAIGLSILCNMILGFVGAHHKHWQDHDNLVETTHIGGLLSVQAAFFALSWIAARYININKFSLFGMYRDRLIRAYLGASNPLRLAETAQTGKGQHHFTGFAESDNIDMHRLTQRPFHVANLTLNLVHGERLAWQQRKAQSFTVSPLHCGNFELGYRPSKEYCGGISLGTAMTISGAAASPNMGYHSTPAAGFIMTLLNARLGAWLGNPGPAGKNTWKLAGPQSAVGSLLKEALGLTTNRSEYVYLSDGGHFENLGLYEMVLRGCRHIVVLDAGCDGDFSYEDLGNALRKIRIDFRIPIEFEAIDKKKRCAVAKINYPGAEPGHILYIKPRLLRDEPPDVTSYWRTNRDFPHQSTADQWFDESQTESYRMLGLHTIESICSAWPKGERIELAEFVRQESLGQTKTAAAGV